MGYNILKSFLEAFNRHDLDAIMDYFAEDCVFLDRHRVGENFGVSEWTMTGTSVSGKKIGARGMNLLEFARGKIIRKDSF